MKTRVRKVQKGCRVAGGEESFVLDFLFLLYQDKRKIDSFLNHLICGFISKTSLSKAFKTISTKHIYK